jgi:hypothetical protein
MFKRRFSRGIAFFLLSILTCSIRADDPGHPLTRAKVGDWAKFVTRERHMIINGQPELRQWTRTTTVLSNDGRKVVVENVFAAATGKTSREEEEFDITKSLPLLQLLGFSTANDGLRVDVFESGIEEIEVTAGRYSAGFKSIQVSSRGNTPSRSSVWTSDKVPLLGIVKLRTQLKDRVSESEYSTELVEHGTAEDLRGKGPK